MCAQRATDLEFEMWAERKALAAEATDSLYDVGTRTLLVARRVVYSAIPPLLRSAMTFACRRFASSSNANVTGASGGPTTALLTYHRFGIIIFYVELCVSHIKGIPDGDPIRNQPTKICHRVSTFSLATYTYHE